MSNNLIITLQKEHEELNARIAEVAIEIQLVRTELDEKLSDLEEERERLQAKARHVEALLTLDGVLLKHTPTATNTRGIVERSARTSLGETVYRLLNDIGEAMHYREIVAALKSRGVEVPGQDPAINLVAHIHDDPRFLRPVRGVYGLREWYPQRAKSVGSRRRRKVSKGQPISPDLHGRRE